MKKLISKIIMLLKDKGPCEECIIKVMCRETCDRKNIWDGGEHSYFVPFMVVISIIVMAISAYFYGLGIMFHHFGLIKSTSKLEMFNVFEEYTESEYY